MTWSLWKSTGQVFCTVVSIWVCMMLARDRIRLTLSWEEHTGELLCIRAQDNTLPCHRWCHTWPRGQRATASFLHGKRTIFAFAINKYLPWGWGERFPDYTNILFLLKFSPYFATNFNIHQWILFATILPVVSSWWFSIFFLLPIYELQFFCKEELSFLPYIFTYSIIIY